MARPSKYPPEFRARAVALVLESGRPIKHVADELGLGPESLRQWVRQHEADHGQSSDRPTSVENQELRRLRKENTELEEPAFHADWEAPLLCGLMIVGTPDASDMAGSSHSRTSGTAVARPKLRAL